MDELQNRLRSIPSIDQIVTEAAASPQFANLSHTLLVQALRQATEQLRKQVIKDQVRTVTLGMVLEEAGKVISQEAKPSLKRVINATGVILHTNLGRAPLSQRAQERITEVMTGYSTLEYDITTGERGTRYSHVEARLCSLTGGEAALVVNNNAAAVLLVLSTLAKGQEVIVSRGQLVEIGGSFRIPEVLEQSGAVLVEVGTTNKTHLADYAKAISPKTGAILKVHTSNYRIVGFTAQPQESQLVKLAHEHGLPIIEDLGSGCLVEAPAESLAEPLVKEKLKMGMDVVTFSGDKLFGGSQAGIIVGKKRYIDLMKQQPLLRAVRIDKLSLAALEGTLMDYSQGNPEQEIPVQFLLRKTATLLIEQATALASGLEQLPGWQAEVIRVQSLVGGGALPGLTLDSYGVKIQLDKISAMELEEKLRQWSTPIITRIQENKVILDVRCLSEQDSDEIREACDVIGRG